MKFAPLFFAFGVFLLLGTNVLAYSNLGNGICECSGCEDCTNALNDSNCYSMVKLNQNIINQAGTCIDNPSNFNNKIFDCQGHTIDGDGRGIDKGIFLSGKQNNIIRNCIITNFHYGIYLYFYSDNNIITNNIVSNNNGDGIYLGHSSNNIITNNTASNNDWNGINLFFSSNNIITNNTASNNNYVGIYLYFYSKNNIITNNTASNKVDGIGLVTSSNNTLTNNIVSNNDYNGIFLLSSSNNIITNNTASDNDWNGIYLESSSNNTLTNNIVINNGRSGINLIDSLNNNIYNNFFNNTINCKVEVGGRIYANNWNTTKSSGPNIIGGPFIGGNFWATPTGTGFSENRTTCNPGTDGFCQNSYTLESNNVDYLPLTNLERPRMISIVANWYWLLIVVAVFLILLIYIITKLL